MYVCIYGIHLLCWPPLPKGRGQNSSSPVRVMGPEERWPPWKKLRPEPGLARFIGAGDGGRRRTAGGAKRWPLALWKGFWRGIRLGLGSGASTCSDQERRQFFVKFHELFLFSVQSLKILLGFKESILFFFLFFLSLSHRKAF